MSFFRNHNNSKINHVNRSIALITNYAPQDVISEEFRTLRTNILYSNADKQIKTLVFTSAGPGEGKSTVSSNVAVTFADQGLKTLLVDADMRKPVIDATFAIENINGLSDFLSQRISDLNMAIRQTSINNLYVLPTGHIPPNPAELLSSKRMAALIAMLEDSFDLVIFDLPPLINVTDAQILASQTDATVLVVPYGIAEKAMVNEAKTLLNKVHANLIGAVMNRVPKSERHQYYGKYYGKY
ncbi:CpsD/CapB family tyrosine-protein kinase [Lacticaseibacillus paracasei]|uniref:CpsD/CapB family tyrosine-protein kinase n=1 Tax=Lacticaseibacillus paracasei TaxID=1597 RepID=UPI000F43CFBC|nr:CpsD/CapB family tyrosine-protein kinase [Lacticaseibacillus paracasei]RND50207.1 Tyrosine-protein kinase YwqD [Lacticaseibacillus paracasei]